MNKLLTKAAKLLLGLSLAAGVGVAIGSKAAERADAAGPNNIAWDSSWVDDSGNSTTGTQSTGSYMKATASPIFVELQGGYRNDNKSYTQSYANKTITVGGDSTVTSITQVVVTAASSSYNGYQSSGSWTVVSGKGDGTITKTNNTTITYSGGTTASVTLKPSKQLQFTNIAVTYTASAVANEIASVAINNAPQSTISGICAGSFGPTLTATATFASGSGTPTWTWASSNASAIKVKENGQLIYVGNGTSTITATASIPASQNGTNVGSVSITTSNLKGLSSSNPITVDEAISLMDSATSGVVVQAELYVIGAFSAGTVYNSSYSQWEGTFAGSNSKSISVKATNDSGVDIGTTNGNADGLECVVKGYLELYNSVYQLSYLPASASPTGSAYTPSIAVINLPVITSSEVETLIAAIGTVSNTAESKAKIDEARAKADLYLAQEGCSEQDISNYSTLTTAEATYTNLVNQAAADAVADLIDALPAANTIVDYSNHSDIVAARTAYNSLTDTQKALVSSEDIAKLEACEAQDALFAPLSFELKHNVTGTSGNMSGDNDAATYFNLDSTLWSVVSIKNEGSTHIGLNKDGDMRLYAYKSNGNGNALQVTALNAAYSITTIEISFANRGTNTVSNSVTSLTGTNDVYTINDSVFTIKNTQNSGSSNVQVQINKVIINYEINQSTTADDFLDAVSAIPVVANITSSNLSTVNDLIEAAEIEYDKLTSELKAESEVITAKATLDAAKAKAIDVGYEVEAADTISAIASLPNPESISDWSHHNDIVAARSLYEALSEGAKAKVSNYQKLVSCETAETPFEPKTVVIDTDGGKTHDEDSTANSSLDNANALASAYPIDSRMLDWSGASYAYGSQNTVLKLGSSSNTGSIVLGFTHNRLYAKTVTLDCRAWTTKSIVVSVNGVESSSFSGVQSSLTFDLTNENFTNSITITTTSSEKRVSIFAITVEYDYRADYLEAKEFENDYILKNIEYPENTPTGVSGTSCLATNKGGLGYFDAAVDYYNSASMSSDARLEFVTHDDFANARERFQAWALANEKTLTFNTSTGAITINSTTARLSLMPGTIENGGTIAIIVIISLVSVTAIGGYFFIKRREEN